ncbi:MAG: Protein LemA [Eubacteriales bacterium SKADARSKE-1]|nr:Protein LemA [Eubacteriales bacterium SKADARSKE-1]
MLISMVLIGLVIILVVWIISVQNKLVSVDEFCKNSLSQIGVQQQSRWDALTALADLTKNYSSFESETLIKIISARKNITMGSTTGDVQNQENLLQKGFASINALAEAYPDLKANSIYIKTMDNVNNYENNVRMSRMVYNDTVTKFNRMVLSFPGSIIAKFLKFDKRNYLEDVDGKKEMPSFK